MFFVLSIFLIIILGVIDNCWASVIAGLVILTVSCLQSQLADRNVRQYAFKVNQIVFFVYFLVAYIFSQAFVNGEFFVVSDPSRYIANYGSSRSMGDVWQNIHDCYFLFADNNALYNTYLRSISVLGNNLLGGTSVFYLTLSQTIFGILGINVLFRILSRYTNKQKAYKATLAYAFCTVFLFYSCIVVRDIIIAYFFLLVIEIVLKPFKSINVAKLIILIIIIWGIRLYSGLFVVSFLGLYLYLFSRNTKWKAISLPIFIIVVLFSGVALIGSSILEQTTTELSEYTEMTILHEEERSGLLGLLYRLPSGLRNIAILFYTQMAPFPPFYPLSRAYSFSTTFMSICIIIYAVFWFFVFYTLLASLFSLKSYKYYSLKERLLFVIAMVFILANTVHPDLRRMMPVYPITYLLYIIGGDRFFPNKWTIHTRSFLLIGYMGLLIVYIALKGL